MSGRGLSATSVWVTFFGLVSVLSLLVTSALGLWLELGKSEESSTRASLTATSTPPPGEAKSGRRFDSFSTGAWFDLNVRHFAQHPDDRARLVAADDHGALWDTATEEVRRDLGERPSQGTDQSPCSPRPYCHITAVVGRGQLRI